ncbi:hypothetical protein J6590_006726 [Homalodisca vitripennis]|nr:hypothetical protein J6590_006726 [Homalodisca vitripennis]
MAGNDNTGFQSETTTRYPPLPPPPHNGYRYHSVYPTETLVAITEIFARGTHSAPVSQPFIFLLFFGGTLLSNHEYFGTESSTVKSNQDNECWISQQQRSEGYFQTKTSFRLGCVALPPTILLLRTVCSKLYAMSAGQRPWYDDQVWGVASSVSVPD